jgi:hypothetical protein
MELIVWNCDVTPNDHAMRHKGRITGWKDDRGFGFITPSTGGSQTERERPCHTHWRLTRRVAHGWPLFWKSSWHTFFALLWGLVGCAIGFAGLVGSLHR